ncbi:MAG: tetratricopeptide repeat protein [Acidobacteria bacterium]|nr:tetratricopeptide repeat protein [Acidobacteriota bacterium]MDA1236346.1 tetratricopeptide repeat protein [Acidobacteriota bacterium]
MARINRKYLKHDKFVEEVGDGIEYFGEHRTTILVGLAVAVVAIVGGGWFYTHQQSQSLDSMAALQEAAVMFSRPVSVDPQPGTQAFVTSGERMREVTEALEKVKVDFPGTSAASAADYYYALFDMETEDYAAAKTKLQSAISGADVEYASLARLALADVLIAEDDVAGARAEYEKLVSSPTAVVPASRAKLALARTIARSDPAAARALLQELVDATGPASTIAAQELRKLPQS